MQIHVVAPGETYEAIAQAYGVTAQQIRDLNQVPNPDRPVTGQALVIPVTGRFYTVQPGDSYWAIAQQFGLTPDEIMQVNQIGPNDLRPGLQLYIPPGPKPEAESNAYLEPQGVPEEQSEVAGVARYLTYLTSFPYHVNRNGTLVPLNDEAARRGAQAGNAAPVIGIANIEGDQFSHDLGAAILSDVNLQDRLLDNVLATMREREFRALNVDFEHLRAEDREAYNNFLRRATQRMHDAGYLISTALAPKVSRQQKGEWYEAHDYRSHGEIVDYVVIMTYEWGWSGGPPMAVAPVSEVRKVLRFAVSEIPREKIMMGIPLYGYDWTLPYVEGGPFAKVVSPQDAILLAAQRGAEIQFDEPSQSPFFYYWDDQGRQHVVWFEDARSIQAKFNLVKEFGLRGVSYWKLPLEFPQNWVLLEDNFTIRKL